jgi:hypothetical protein
MKNYELSDINLAEYRYRILSKNRLEDSEFVMKTDQMNRALEVAQIHLDTWSKADNRTGSLRGDGRVDFWIDGVKTGYVIIEEYKHGQYVRIGG